MNNKKENPETNKYKDVTFEIASKQSQVDIKNIRVPVKPNENKK